MKDFELIANAERTSEISDHLCFLYFLVNQLPQHPMVLELGVSRGESTRALLQAVYENDGMMCSVDIEKCDEIRQWAYKNEYDEGTLNTKHVPWIFIQGDDLKIDFENKYDMIFLDTNHEYKHTLKELEKFVPMVKKGGYFVMHDVNHVLYRDAINLAVDEYFKNRIGFTFYRFYHNNGLLVIKVE